MIVVHIESGLGNQMLGFCEYIALKKQNPNQDIYIETIIYEIPECSKVICQWNGYELERIFRINAPNVKSLFTDEEWAKVIDDVRKSKFWEHNWNWPSAICSALNKAGLNLKNCRGNFREVQVNNKYNSLLNSIKNLFKNSYLGLKLKRFNNVFRQSKWIKKHDNRQNLFLKTNENIYTGHYLSFKMTGNDRFIIDDDIRRTFVFPNLIDKKNIDITSYLDKNNSIAIHARRGDMLSANGWCYKSGYFRRAVKYLRKKISNPVFVFFTDPGSIEWCKNNSEIFGLDFNKDIVLFVDWNTGENSFRDMQVMSHCKHAIITNSSFGWWGAYLIKNPNKITISPLVEFDTTYHC